jgi:hypothetical protein
MIGYFRHGNWTQPCARLYVSNRRDSIREISYPSLETLSLSFELWGMTIICTVEFPVPPRNKPDRVRSCFIKWSLGSSEVCSREQVYEIPKRPSILAFKGGSNSEMHHFLCQPEFHPVLTCLSFFLSASTATTYIFTVATCTTTIIT